MSSQKLNSEAAKAVFNNANQIVDLALNRSVELLEKNIKATKDSIERHSSYATTASSIRNPEAFAKLQKDVADKESKALETFTKDVYQLSNEAAKDITEVSDNSRSFAEEVVTESLEQVAQSIPNGSTQPYGAVFGDFVRSQIGAYKTFNGLVEKAISAQRDNFDAMAKVVDGAATVAKSTTKKKK